MCMQSFEQSEIGGTCAAHVLESKSCKQDCGRFVQCVGSGQYGIDATDTEDLRSTNQRPAGVQSLRM